MGEMTKATGAGVVRILHREAPTLRLLCVPYAGAGAAAYGPLLRALPAEVEPWVVRLPGRESRLREEPLTDVASVVASLLGAFGPDGPMTAPGPGGAPLPYALFGHSMGALICVELARELRRRGRPGPHRLLVSGRRAPQVPVDVPGIHGLPDGEFVAAVRRLNGIPDEVLREPGLIELLEPALRADFAVCETYRDSGAETPMGCDISAFGGTCDPTTTPEWLAGWRTQTTGVFTMRLYSGDHFFLNTHTRRIAAALGHDLLA